MFPTPCTRCGGVLYQHVAFCPYCGVSQPIASAQPKRAETQLRAVRKAPSPAADDDSDDASLPEIRWSDLPETLPAIQYPFWRKPPRRIVVGGAVFALMVVLAGVGFQRLGASHRNDDFVEPMKTGVNDASSALPPSTMPSGADASARMSNSPAMTGAAPAAGQYGNNVSAALGVARASLEQRNLAAAKAAVAQVLAVAPRNADALRMQADIADRENERDAALRVATICAKDVIWSCVVKQANQALAADSGSKDAQILLERAIVSNGWKPLSESAPARATAAAPTRRAPPQQRVATNAMALPTLPPLPPGIPADNATRPSTDAVARRTSTAINPDYAPVSGGSSDANAPGVQQ
ncbi:hypothetical protein [Paraburkholderia sp. C35]|uniref:hypothetical protein n=1 Tax=Paraburkholderia sp. C35 TaxID=2126993 RepID=UPI000D6980F3|nr:hypothetical protein [Paraburkholderia sp. C35]